MEQITNKEVLEKLNQILSEINIIKKNMVDIDCILTSEEEERHEESLTELEKGETFTFEDIEKERLNNAGL